MVRWNCTSHAELIAAFLQPDTVFHSFDLCTATTCVNSILHLDALLFFERSWLLLDIHYRCKKARMTALVCLCLNQSCQDWIRRGRGGMRVLF